MAQSPTFSRSYGNPASRLAYERPWSLVLAVLAIFVLYAVSGRYSFTQPLTLNQPSAEISAASFAADTGALTDSGVIATGGSNLSLQPATPQEAPAAAVSAQAIAAAAQRWATAGVVLVAGGQEWDAASLANVDAALSLLPPDVLAGLGNPDLGPLHVLVNTAGRSFSGSQPYGGAANYFSTNDGVNELVLYPGQRVATVLHELGHAYNLRATPAGRYAQVLVDPEMESFLAATRWRVLTPREAVATAVDHTQMAFDYRGTFRWPELSHFDPLEDFANTFATYYADPAGLRVASPERYAWMEANLPK